MHKRAVLTSILFLLATVVISAANTFTLVIDAGHGGHDCGAKGAVSQEKNINLSVALAFGKYVEDNCKDVKVIYTRTTDVFVPLKERANIANRNNADLFVSVHTNALPNGRIARGFEVYTLGMHRAKDNLDVAMRENSVISMENDYKQTYQGFDPKSSESYIMFEFMQSANMEKSVALAKLIEKSVCETADRTNMGVHQAGFLVLRETSMPSCLIELGFITTPDEEEFLNTDDGVDKLAKGIYLAFVDYKNKYHGKTITNTSANKKAKTTEDKKPKVTAAAPAKIADTGTKQTAKATNVAKQGNAAEKNIQKDKTPKVDKAKPNASVKKPEPPVDTSKKINNKLSTAKTDANAPVFKVQIFALGRKIENGDPLFKGHKDVSSYKEGNSRLVKYTVGSSTDYSYILNLRKSLLEDFPYAYVVAFKDGKTMNLSQAIAEYKQNKKTHKNDKK